MGGGAGAADHGEPLDGPEDGGGLKRAAFERLVERLAADIPTEYLDGVLAIDVSPRTVPHPSRADVFTMGECVPVEGDGEDLCSRIVLYHGSFRALAELRDDFDWQAEAWETLTHEVRHHVEWRARADQLEDYDWAAEQNFARHEGDAFDPLFFLDGELLADGVYRVDDDVFHDRPVRALPHRMQFRWDDQDWEVDVPEGTLPLFLVVDGVHGAPEGDLVVVVRRPVGLLDLLRRRHPPRSAGAVARRASGG